MCPRHFTKDKHLFDIIISCRVKITEETAFILILFESVNYTLTPITYC